MSVTSYKCINCDGVLVFDAETGKMKCEYCDSVFEPEVVQDYEKYRNREEQEIKWEKKQDEEFETNEVKVYICESCGAEIIADENTASTQCPYCDNVTVLNDHLSGVVKPDLVIPFKVTKEEAKAKIKQFCKGKKLLPTGFLEDSKIEEIKGMYVPFWLFSAKADADIVYRGQRITRSRVGNTETIRTHHYMLQRQGGLEFDKIPVDGSTKIDNVQMESIEPYDYSEAIPFATAYLSGYLADKYDDDSDNCKPRANERITNSTLDEFRQTVSTYANVMVMSKNLNLESGDIKYAMLPVWMLTSKWKDEKYLYIINGQTGKLAGNLPVDKKKAFAWFGGIALALTAVINVIVQLML